jgi:hypothetical protein
MRIPASSPSVCLSCTLAFSPEAIGATGVLEEDKAFREAVDKYEREREGSKDCGPRNERIDVKVRVAACVETAIGEAPHCSVWLAS